MRSLSGAGNAFLAWLVLGATLPTAAAELAPGTRGVVVTVLEGTALEEIPVTFLGTYRDFAGPGYDVHLVRLEGPHAERIGVAAGMSGSPVYIDGEVIGALSYRLGLLPRDAVAGVTPLADMLDSARAGAAAPGSMAGATPIAAPLVVSGLTAAAREWLGSRVEPFGLVLAAGGGQAEAPSSAPLRPGSPVGVQLVRGDMRIAATGTVSWVDGDRVWAFGHPFLGSGRIELPMVAAEVLYTLADLAGSVKLSNVGPEIGAFLEDRRAAIVGRQGARVPMMPLTLDVAGGDYRDSRFQFELVRNSQLAPLMAAVVVLNTLQSAPGYSQSSTLKLSGSVDLGPLGALPVEMAFAGSTDGDPSVAAATQLLALLASLWANPFAELEVRSINLDVAATSEVVSYRLEHVLFDRRSLRAGETLEIHCSLQRFQGGTETRRLELALPALLPDTEELVLAVGNPLTLDRALGSRLFRRLQSARDIASYLAVLSDIRSAHRLTAVIYDRQGATVARGSEFDRLPPTIERLLSTQAPSGARNAVSLSPLTWAEQELAGPLIGLETIALRIERGREKPAVEP